MLIKTFTQLRIIVKFYSIYIQKTPQTIKTFIASPVIVRYFIVSLSQRQEMFTTHYF